MLLSYFTDRCNASYDFARASALVASLSLHACCSDRNVHATTDDTSTDPRVVKVGEHYYPYDDVPIHARNRARNRDASLPAGVLKPDESNGKCRLFAPNPGQVECCSESYGLDLQLLRASCGLGEYLGESYGGSCGYFFRDTEPHEALQYRGFEVGWATGADAHASALAYAEMHKYKFKRSDFTPRALDETSGIQILVLDQHLWAFVPGWTTVRKVAWTSTHCSLAAMEPVLRSMVPTVQPNHVASDN